MENDQESLDTDFSCEDAVIEKRNKKEDHDQLNEKHVEGTIFPSRPQCTKPKQGADGEAARLWRKKKILNGLKSRHSEGQRKDNDNGNCGLRNPPKTRREPLPMRKRALPQSFWKEPATMQTSSLAGNVYPVLPPLFTTENNNTDMTEIRPVTPPGESRSKKESKRPTQYLTSAPNVDLLFSLFDQFENKLDEKRLVRRGRPKKQQKDKETYKHPPKREEDPYMVDALSEKLFPQLSLTASSANKNEKFAIIKLKTRGQTVELPAIQLEQNYSVMLDELAMHL